MKRGCSIASLVLAASLVAGCKGLPQAVEVHDMDGKPVEGLPVAVPGKKDEYVYVSMRSSWIGENRLTMAVDDEGKLTTFELVSTTPDSPFQWFQKVIPLILPAAVTALGKSL